jgi:hypothetical protein
MKSIFAVPCGKPRVKRGITDKSLRTARERLGRLPGQDSQ